MNKSKSRYISLNRKIIVSFSIPILIFILIISIFINKVIKDKFEDYIKLKQKHAIDNIEFNLYKSYNNDTWDISRLKATGEELLTKGIVLEIQDKYENNIWSMYEHELNDCEKMLDEINSNMTSLYPLWEDNIVKNKSPIYNYENKLVGYKILNYHEGFVYMTDEITFITTINKTLAVFCIISIIILFTLTVAISKNISDPIKRVSYITENIEQGKYKSLEYKGNIKEVNNLILSINNLSSTLESQDHIRKRLITDLSHELSNPLTSIHGHLRAMIDGIWQPTNERIVSIDTELLRIIDLIEELKSLNKLENEPMLKEKVKLKNLINVAIHNLEAIALEKNISINYDLDDIIANVDRSKIIQVIVNILSNSIKYTNDNGQIDIKLYEKANKAYISIKDNGIGIKQDEIKYIFERFYRVNNFTVNKSNGLGVGLSICKFIVDEHGGDIEVYSELGKGSEFIIILNIV